MAAIVRTELARTELPEKHQPTTANYISLTRAGGICKDGWELGRQHLPHLRGRVSLLLSSWARAGGLRGELVPITSSSLRRRMILLPSGWARAGEDECVIAVLWLGKGGRSKRGACANNTFLIEEEDDITALWLGKGGRG